MRKILSICFVLVNAFIFAQNSVEGTVQEYETQSPLAGVNVYIPELQKGSITDANGEYKIINIPKGKFKIVFSFIGYETMIKTIDVSGERIRLNCELLETIIHSQTVVISGGKHSTQHENAIKIENINSEQLLIEGNTSILKGISKIPGVEMISKGNSVATPVIRGLSTSNILMLEDGIRLESFQFSENHPYLIDEFGIQQVEVVKGPASLLYGSDAIGGVINVVSEEPAKQGTLKATLFSSYQSNSEGLANNLGVKGNNKLFYWNFNSSTKSFKDYTDGDNQQVKNTRMNQESMKFTVGKNTKLSSHKISYRYNTLAAGLSVPQSIVLIDGNDYENEFWYQDLESHLVYLKNKIYLNRFKFEVDGSYQLNNRRLIGSELTPAKTMVHMDLSTLGGQVKGQYAISNNAEMILASQLMIQENKNAEAPSHVLPDFEIDDVGFFGLLQYGFNQKLHSQLGLRYDMRQINIPEQSNSAEIDKDYQDVSGSLGFTYQLFKQILVRVNFASAYRTPNIAELSQDGVHGNRYERGNVDLNSQRSYEADFSTHFHSKNFLADVSLFLNSIENYIYLAPTLDTSSAGLQIYEYNQDRAELKGFEINLSYLPYKWLTLNSSYAFIEGKKDNHEYLPFIPQNKLNFSTKFMKKVNKKITNVYLKPEVVYAQEHSNPANFETKTPEYWMGNLWLGASFNFKKVQPVFTVKLENITDEAYYSHLSTLKSLGYYNMGRSVNFSLLIPIEVKN